VGRGWATRLAACRDRARIFPEGAAAGRTALAPRNGLTYALRAMERSPAPQPAPRRQVSLRVGIATAFVVLVLATSALLCAVLLQRMREGMRADLRTRIADLAALAALAVDGELHARVAGPADEGSPAVRELRRRLQEVRAGAPDLRFVYTVRQTAPDRFAFWIDASDGPDGSRIGDPVKSVTPRLREAFARPARAVVEPEFETDEWGTWLSAYSPVHARDGRLEAVVGVDLPAAAIAAKERGALLVLLALAALVTVPVVLCGLWLSGRIVRPLRALEADMARVRHLDLEGDLVLESRFREIVRMRDAVLGMKSGLRSFRKYVPTDLVRELIRDGQEAELGGRRAELTVFFSDIAGFTALAESTTPEGLAADLADYFDLMTRTILESGGTVDKYIGDAVMAFWGAPTARPDHAAAALRAALLLRGRLAELNAERGRRGRPPIHTRIGLATGEVMVGNFGYAQRLNYTVMGDTVNLASRLEGLNQHVGTTVLCSAATARAAGAGAITRLLGVVAVKGKREGVRIHEPLATAAEAPALAARATAWNAAFERYLARDFAGAAPVFAAWLQDCPEDEPAARLVAQCRELAAHPPGPEWNGTVVMNSK